MMPNAWPSQEMVQRSLFLQAALAKPWYTYFTVLLRFSPVHIIGLGSALHSLAYLGYLLIVGYENGSNSGAAVASARVPLLDERDGKIHENAHDSSDVDPAKQSVDHSGEGRRLAAKEWATALLTARYVDLIFRLASAGVVLSLPLAFLGGLTFIGYMGAGE